MNGRDGTTTFLLPDSKIGGHHFNRPSIGQFLTREQASYVNKKTESSEMINVDTIQQEIEQEEQLNKIDDTSGETNLYRELIVNNEEKIEPLMTQMEQSVLSNVLNYIQHDIHYIINNNLSIKAVNKYKNSSETKGEREVTELDFGVTPRILHEDIIKMYMREFNQK